MFGRLDRPTHTERIVERFKELLFNRELLPGDRLPSEREMADQFGVSRASIREAISALTALGVLEARTGDGTYVNTNITKSVLEPLSWAFLTLDQTAEELVETRKVIEPEIAALAAVRADQLDKEKLLHTIDEMRSSLGEPRAVAEADLAFHFVLAEAARNRFFLGMMNGLQRLIEGLIASHKLDIKTHEDTLEEHIAIYNAVLEADPEKARQMMFKNIKRGFFGYNLEKIASDVGEGETVLS